MDHLHTNQENEYFCGPAVIQMALAVFGTSIMQKEAARLAGTDADRGTLPENLVRTLRSFGLRADGCNNRTLSDVRAALGRGEVVIICYTERHWGWGHYALVRGIDESQIHLLDPAEPIEGGSMSIKEFESRWHDPLFTKSVQWAAFVSNLKK